MQENNMSVFGTVIRNEEIADFMRLLNLAREIFKQELTVVEIMQEFPRRDRRRHPDCHPLGRTGYRQLYQPPW